MKLNGRSLKRRLYGLKSFPERIARVRYFRGHGVHSPFVYQLVRQAFMKREVISTEPVLMGVLRERGVANRHARELQNLYTHLDYQSFAIDQLTNPCQLCVLTPKLDKESSVKLIERAAQRGTTVAVLAPYEGKERQELCQRLVQRHTCTSVDKRGYLLLFSHQNLPKQHYRI